MKILVLILSVWFATAQCQESRLLRQGLVMTPEKTKAQIEAERKAEIAEANRRLAVLVAGAPYRSVTGKVYGVMGSKLWTTLDCGPGLQRLVVRNSESYGLLIDIEEYKFGDWQFDRQIVLTNFPGKDKVVTGQVLPSIRALEVGNHKFRGVVLSVYDYGTRTNLPSASK